MASDPAPTPGLREGSLRLLISWDAAGARLEVVRPPRDKPAPTTADLTTEPPLDVVVLELRDSDGRLRYRRLLAEPFPQTGEIFDETGRMSRVAYARPTGAHSVVVPRPTEPMTAVLSVGREVELAQPPLAAPPGRRPRFRELARLLLRPE